MRKLIREIRSWWLTWKIMRNKELKESLRMAQKQLEEGQFLTRDKVFNDAKIGNSEFCSLTSTIDAASVYGRGWKLTSYKSLSGKCCANDEYS